jgi:hypothetical protein
MPRTRKVITNVEPPLKFDRRLVLNQYFLGLFGIIKLEELGQEMNHSKYEGYTNDNKTNFYQCLIDEFSNQCQISNDKLLQYDDNIVRHTQRITGQREDGFTWKYHQYLSLLFTEIYLDLYFHQTDKLLNDLNEYVNAFNNGKNARDQIRTYQLNDLNKLAFWNATGSGKTLIMHVNYLQYHYYLEQSSRSHELNRTILLTPNEGLSHQHLVEFRLSGLQAELFDKTAGSLVRPDIEVIDINKIKDEEGDKTVAVGAFEGNNLVFVDEGHRGSSGVEWKSKRDQLCEHGFSFEYSATFGQAMKASGKEDLIQEYAKCILFDYSYRYFHDDGFGKEYRILNMEDDSQEDKRQLYLTACLLTYYQQKRLFEDYQNKLLKNEKKEQFSSFLIENPLLIFVGSSVLRGKQNTEASDIVEVLKFFSDFIKREQMSINAIDRLLGGNPGLLDNKGHEVFRESFSYLSQLSISSRQIYQDLSKRIFHSTLTGAELHLDNLKGVAGEIGIRIGNQEYFGVINVGDDSKLLKLCEDNGLHTDTRDFADSLYRQINEKLSTINVLIGAKKFTEGWSSWRVATMGLMNVGKTEGSEIIQLFGRGVRLKGHQFSLKRSEALMKDVPSLKPPKFIETLETLNIFGVKANYMKQFQEYLKEEGTDNESKQIIELPIKRKEITDIPTLKILKLKDGLNFKQNGVKPVLDLLHDPKLRNQIVVDWYSKLQMQSSTAQTNSEIVKHSGILTKQHLAFVSWDNVYFQIQNYKNQKSWYNFNISKEVLQNLLYHPDWYTLYISEDELAFNNFRDFRKWQEIAIVLLKKYCDVFYKRKKSEWEFPHLPNAPYIPSAKARGFTAHSVKSD